MNEGDTSDPVTAEEVLFSEPGGTWWWLLAGPAAGGAMMAIQLSAYEDYKLPRDAGCQPLNSIRTSA